MTPSDTELLRRFWAERDQAAFKVLVERHLSMVYFAALRQVGGDQHLAQDVSQEVFTRLAQKAKELAGHGALVGWLYKAARYEGAHAAREAERRRRREQEAHADTLPPERVQEEWVRLRPVIDEALLALPADDREMILQRFFSGRGYEEIGRELGKSADAVRFRVGRALEKLRQKLRARGVDSTTVAISLALGCQAEGAVADYLPSKIVTSATSIAPIQASSGLAIGLVQLAAVLSVVGVVTSGTLAVRAIDQERLARVAAEGSAQAYQVQVTELERLKARLARDQTVAATGRRPAEASKGGAVDGKTKKPTAKLAVLSPARKAALAALGKDPQIRKDFFTFFKAVNMTRSKTFLEAHGLSDEEIDRYTTLETADGGYTIGDVEAELASPTESAQNAADKEQLLAGRVGAADLAQHNSAAQLEEVVRGLAGALYATPDTLSADQGKQLLAAIVAHSSSLPNSRPSATGVAWPEVLTEARSFLSPAQADMLQAQMAFVAVGGGAGSDGPGGIGSFAALSPLFFGSNH